MMAAFLESGFCHTYTVKLLFINRPRIKMDLLKKSIKKKVDGAHIEYDYSDEKHVFAYSNSSNQTATQICMLPMTWVLDTSKYEDALLQNRDWSEANSIVERCRYSITVHDAHASDLKPRNRIDLFNKVLYSIVETLKCDALYFKASDRIVSPQIYMNAMRNNESLFGAINVRMHQEDSCFDDYRVAIDTLGLAALGLPDIQFSVSSRECKDSAYLLYKFARNILENGDSYRDGQMCTFNGSNWMCRRQLANRKPQRYVLDLKKREYSDMNQNPPMAQNL